jgi:hypothetical protein
MQLCCMLWTPDEGITQLQGYTQKDQPHPSCVVAMDQRTENAVTPSTQFSGRFYLCHRILGVIFLISFTQERLITRCAITLNPIQQRQSTGMADDDHDAEILGERTALLPTESVGGYPGHEQAIVPHETRPVDPFPSSPADQHGDKTKVWDAYEVQKVLADQHLRRYFEVQRFIRSQSTEQHVANPGRGRLFLGRDRRVALWIWLTTLEITRQDIIRREYWQWKIARDGAYRHLSAMHDALDIITRQWPSKPPPPEGLKRSLTT